MIPVVQTKVVVTNLKGEQVVNGNCFAAAVASIMEVPITEVPNIEVLFDVENSFWLEVLDKFLTSKGWELRTGEQYKIFHPEFEVLMQSPDSRTDLEYTNDMRIILEDDYYFVTGPSPRGINHVVIYKAGEIVHDPHPSKDGIVELKYFETLKRWK